jgi:hypothetical protein
MMAYDSYRQVGYNETRLVYDTMMHAGTSMKAIPMCLSPNQRYNQSTDGTLRMDK